MKKHIVLILFLVWPVLTAAGQVSINTTGEPPVSSAMLDIKSTTGGLLIPRMTESQIVSIFDPADGLQVYCTTDGRLYIFVALDNSWKEVAFGERELFPPSAYSIGTGGICTNTVVHGTYVIDNTLDASNYITIQVVVSVPGHYSITTSQLNGYSFSASGDFSNTGLQSVNLSGSGIPVNSGTDHFYATASGGGGTCQFGVNVLSWICGMPLTIEHLSAAGVAPVDKTVTYGTVTGIRGEDSKCWITSNLGADHQASGVSDATEPSAGWYWQFGQKQGYKHDGTIRTPGTTWISSVNENLNWYADSDPCYLELGSGWHLPSYTEWFNVDNGENWNNGVDAWDSELKLHAAGQLIDINGSLTERGTIGLYWSNTQNIADQPYQNGYLLYFQSVNANMDFTSKARGLTVRCIKGL